MSKAILISIKPKWVAKILNGKKTIEIRKAMPKCDLPIDVYIYCTKEKELFYNRDTQKWVATKNRKNVKRLSNGVVKAKFTLNKVEEISWQIGVFQLEQRSFSDFLNKCCLGFCEFKNYLNKKNGYAWHIDNLVIFDRPKELSEFYKRQCPLLCMQKDTYYCDKCPNRLTKAPQNMVYVEVDE